MGDCAVISTFVRRSIDRVPCDCISRASDAALALDNPVEEEWAQLKNALVQGARAYVRVQQRGGWRRGTPVTPNDLAIRRMRDTREVHAALLTLQF